MRDAISGAHIFRISKTQMNLFAPRTYVVCKWRQVGEYEISNDYVISKIADERIQGREKNCRSESWETRNEFNSPQPPLSVCVRIEVSTRIDGVGRTRGMWCELERADI
jgi:hypothetical protein